MDEIRRRGGCECHVVRSVADAEKALGVVRVPPGIVRDTYRTATDTAVASRERRTLSTRR
jgi:hypothetical protein